MIIYTYIIWSSSLTLKYDHQHLDYMIIYTDTIIMIIYTYTIIMIIYTYTFLYLVLLVKKTYTRDESSPGAFQFSRFPSVIHSPMGWRHWPTLSVGCSSQIIAGAVCGTYGQRIFIGVNRKMLYFYFFVIIEFGPSGLTLFLIMNT